MRPKSEPNGRSGIASKGGALVSSLSLAQLIECVPDPTVAIYPDGRILECNKLFAESLRAKDMEGLRRGNIFDFISEMGAEGARSDLEKALREGSVDGKTYFLKREDGSEFTAEVFIKAIKRNDALLVVCVLKNVSGRASKERMGANAMAEKRITPQDEYKRPFDETADAIILADAETGLIVDCNRSALKMIGYEKAEIVGRHRSTIHPPGIGAMEGELSRLFRRHLENTEVETQIVMKSGELKDVTLKALILEINGKKIMQTTLREMANYPERFEMTLRESEERCRELANALEMVVFEADLSGKITFFNNNAFEMTGYTMQNVGQGLDMLQFIVPEERGRVLENIKKLLAGELKEPTDYTIIRRDGTTFPGLVRSSLIITNNRVMGIRGVVFDITRQKKMQEELNQNEAKFRTVFDKAAIGTVILTLEGSITKTNEAFCKMLGFSEEELLGKNVADITYQEDVANTRSMLEELASGKVDMMHYEERYVRKNGGIIWGFVSKSGVRITGDKPLYILAQIQDITERKKAEEALKESVKREHLFTELVNNASVAVSVGFPDGRMGAVNPAFERLTGYSQEELKTITWKTLLTPPEYREMEEEKLSELRRTKQHVRYEKEYIRKDGSRVPIELNVQPYLDNEGNLIYYLAFITDITDRKRMEVALAESEARFRTAFLQASIGMTMMTTDGVYLNANEALCKVLGYRRDELLGKNILETTHPDDIDLTRQHIGEAAKPSSSAEHYEKRFVTKGGQIIWAVVDTSAITDEKGNALYLLGQLQDITKRKEAEERLRLQTRVLESMNRILLVTLSTEDEEQLCRMCLEVVCEITESQLGYMEEIDENLNVKNMVVNEKGWDGCKLPRKEAHESLNAPFVHLAREIITSGRSIIINDFQSSTRTHDLPDGHPKISSFLGIPVKINQNITTLIGLANKKEGYTEKDRRVMEMLSVSIAEAVNRFKTKDVLSEQRALKRSEERFRGIAERSFDAIVTLDTEGKITYCSPSISKILGFTAEEMLNTNIIDAPWHNDKAAFQKLFSGLNRENDVQSITIPKTRKDGILVFVEGNASPILQNNEIVGYQAILRDVTAKLKAQKDLEKSEHKYRELFEVSPIAILDVDLPDVMSLFIQERQINLISLKEFINNSESIFNFFVSLKIKNANRAALELFDVETVEGLNSSFSGFFRSADSKVDNKNITKAISGKYKDILEGKEVEIHGVTSTGKQMALGVRMSIFELGEQNPRAIIALNDMTERYQLMKMKDQFVSAITHELRTPLLSVVGYLEYMRNGRAGPVPEKMKPHLETVMRNSLRLKSITDDLLDLSKIDAGKFELKIETVDLKEVLDQCVAEAVHILSEKPHTIHTGMPGEPVQIQCDRGRFIQIVMNLLSNAIKYSPRGGEVNLSASLSDGMLKVEVSDEGIGIKKEDLPRVFDRFATIQKSIYAKGTGLGLSVTKELVEAHGGKIWVESAGEGKGSTFTCVLPVKR